VAGWLGRRHGWEIDPAWMVTTPGVVTALFTAVQAFTEPGDRVLIQPPVYHPFTYAIEKNDRLPARSPLIPDDGRYRMDFEGLEMLARDPAVKLAILCSPHNPIGRVWTREELRRSRQRIATGKIGWRRCSTISEIITTFCTIFWGSSFRKCGSPSRKGPTWSGSISARWVSKNNSAATG